MSTAREEKEWLVRRALSGSRHFRAQVADLDVIAMCKKPIMSLTGWTEAELRAALIWASDGGDVPPRIAEYVRMVRAPEAP